MLSSSGVLCVYKPDIGCYLRNLNMFLKLMHVTNILAVMYVRKINTFLKLLNHPETNCNMSIPHHHHLLINHSLIFCNVLYKCIHLHYSISPEIVNDILFDFPSNGVNVLGLVWSCLVKQWKGCPL